MGTWLVIGPKYMYYSQNQRQDRYSGPQYQDQDQGTVTCKTVIRTKTEALWMNNNLPFESEVPRNMLRTATAKLCSFKEMHLTKN